MTQQADKRIGIRRAAELICRTSKPSSEQMQRVAELIARGDLAGDSRGTTVDAVADLIAKAAIEKQSGSRSSAQRTRQIVGNEHIDNVYRQSLKQYFLAVILRRKVQHASKHFQRAVLAGQIALLLGVGLMLLASLRSMFPPLTPERAAAVDWLAENTEHYRVIRFHPTTVDEHGNARLWVEYHYTTPQGRGIDTRRIFTIADRRIVSVDAEE